MSMKQPACLNANAQQQQQQQRASHQQAWGIIKGLSARAAQRHAPNALACRTRRPATPGVQADLHGWHSRACCHAHSHSIWHLMLKRHLDVCHVCCNSQKASCG